MSEPIRMPSDSLTGLPYPILTTQTAARYLPADENYHHHFYPRRSPELEGLSGLTREQLQQPEHLPLEVLAGYALRMCRGQLLPKPIHNRTHQRFGLGPTLPETVDEKFKTVVLACAGVVSRHAIDPTAPVAEQVVLMTDAQFRHDTTPKKMCPERYYCQRAADHRRRLLGTFFLRFAAERDMSDISPRLIAAFLSRSTGEQRKREIGGRILREALEAGVEPFEPTYQSLLSMGCVQEGKTGLLRSVRKTIHPDRVQLVFPNLVERLRAVA